MTVHLNKPNSYINLNRRNNTYWKYKYQYFIIDITKYYEKRIQID